MHTFDAMYDALEYFVIAFFSLLLRSEEWMDSNGIKRVIIVNITYTLHRHIFGVNSIKNENVVTKLLKIFLFVFSPVQTSHKREKKSEKGFFIKKLMERNVHLPELSLSLSKRSS